MFTVTFGITIFDSDNEEVTISMVYRLHFVVTSLQYVKHVCVSTTFACILDKTIAFIAGRRINLHVFLYAGLVLTPHISNLHSAKITS